MDKFAICSRRLTQEQFGQASLEEYLETNGRDSGRKDLLSKIISNKTDMGDPPLTDVETSMEIGNLVFAGSGTLQDNQVGQRGRPLT
jgi:cytochrome P450